MIRFSEGTKPFPDIKLPSEIDEFRNIKSDLDVEEAREYWNKKFSDEPNFAEVTEEQLIADVYGCSEEDFSFDTDVSKPEIQASLEQFEDSIWENKDIEEKKACISDFAEIVALDLGIDNRPDIEYYKADPCDCGCFDPEENVIKINENNLENPNEVVNTVAHEMRHAYQYQRAQNIENYKDLLYAYNFSHYITPYETEDGFVGFTDYQDQYIEAEARAYADQFAEEEAFVIVWED